MDPTLDSIRPPVAPTWELRKAVVQFLGTRGTPVGVCEIQKHIHTIPALFDRIARKSNDYTRVTLMTTSRDLIAKFHAGTDGPRGRKLYWGLPGVDYGGAWIRVGDNEKLPRSARSSKTVKSNETKLNGTIPFPVSHDDSPGSLAAVPIEGNMVEDHWLKKEDMPMLDHWLKDDGLVPFADSWSFFGC